MVGRYHERGKVSLDRLCTRSHLALHAAASPSRSAKKDFLCKAARTLGQGQDQPAVWVGPSAACDLEAHPTNRPREVVLTLSNNGSNFEAKLRAGPKRDAAGNYESNNSA